MADTKTPLTQWEASRVKTEFEDRHGKRIKYRYLVGYSPEQVAARFGVRAVEVAKMAGRENERKEPDHD
jgi:hypothetical protein